MDVETGKIELISYSVFDKQTGIDDLFNFFQRVTSNSNNLDTYRQYFVSDRSAIRPQNFFNRLKESMYQSTYELPNSHYFAAYDDKGICAVSILIEDNNNPGVYISSLIVDPDMQKRGIGFKLKLFSLENCFNNLNGQYVVSNVLPNNKGSLKLNRKIARTTPQYIVYERDNCIVVPDDSVWAFDCKYDCIEFTITPR